MNNPWAATNLSPEEVAADGLVESGNLAAINLALAPTRYTDAMGYEGDMLQGRALHLVKHSAARLKLSVLCRTLAMTATLHRMEVMEKLRL